MNTYINKTILADLKRQLEDKEQELRIEKLRIPIKQYYNAIGYILEDNLSFLELKRISENLPEVPKTSEEDGDIKNQISILSKKRSEYSNELSEVNSLIEQINNNNSAACSYSNKLSRFELTSDFEENKDNIECPVCHQKVSKIEETLKAIKASRASLITELKNVGKYQHDSSEHIERLTKQRDSCKKNIKLVSAEITNLTKITKSVIKEQSLRETLMFLRGRVDATLEQILERPSELKDEISQLRYELKKRSQYDELPAIENKDKQTEIKRSTNNEITSRTNSFSVQNPRRTRRRTDGR